MFQILPFYNLLNEKSRIKDLTNIDLLHKLPFYDELSIFELSDAFGWYARSYKVEIVESKDLLTQLEGTKLSIKDFFKYLLDKIKGFEYQITVKVSLRKHKGNGDIEFAIVCFNSTTKALINIKYMLDKSFQEILCRIDNLINERSCWMIESVDAEYVNISIYSPLSGSTYIKLPNKLKYSMRGLINIKSNDNKCFLWYHIYI